VTKPVTTDHEAGPADAASPRVIIIGGGLAGMAAAEAISRFAPTARVTVLEARREFGGRAGSFVDSASGERIDYCQHIAMGCCTNLLDLLERCRLANHFHRYQALTFLHPEFPASRFAASPLLPPPLHLLGTIGAQQYLTSAQKREIKLGLWKLMRSSPRELESVRAADWLARAGQSESTLSAFWNVILVSALGEETERVSMAAARKVIVDGFAAARGASDVLVPTLPLSDLFGRRMVEALTQRGVEFHASTPVKQITPDRCVATRQGFHQADAIISAVPWHKIADLFSDWKTKQTELLPDFNQIEQIPASPITGLHLWFDRPITNLPHAVMVGTVAQWLFQEPIAEPSADETPQTMGASSPLTAGPHDPSASAAAAEHYCQVVISGSGATESLSRADLVHTVLAELRHAFPEARQAKLLRHRIVTDPQSVFSIRPEVERIRPAARTGCDWLFLAGDWTKSGWPATMEGAVISGRIAAEHVLDVEAFSGCTKSPHKRCAVNPPLPPGHLARWLIRSE
jgi:squalene-associated FAD-dependent desaturase